MKNQINKNTLVINNQIANGRVSDPKHQNDKTTNQQSEP